ENIPAARTATIDTTKRLDMSQSSMTSGVPARTVQQAVCAVGSAALRRTREPIGWNVDVRLHVGQQEHRAPVQPCSRPFEWDLHTGDRTIVLIVVLRNDAPDW